MSKAREWIAPIGLIVLSLVPVLAGAARLSELTGGGEITASNERFFASPIPVVTHIVTVTVYSILGALQFAPALRRKRRPWHRVAGRVLVPAGILAALSGLWMSLFYVLPAGDGFVLMIVRVVVSVAMIASIVVGFRAVLRRDFTAHSAWMTRAYALALGAGTQVLLLIPGGLVFGFKHELSRTILMGAAWAINLGIAEWVIRRRARPATSTMRAAVYRRFGGPVSIETVTRPRIRAGELLVRVSASTVSAADYRARTLDVPAGLGLLSRLALGFRRPRHPILGMEVAGTIVAVGSRVSRFRPGDEIVALLGTRFGGHAEFAVIPSSAPIALKPPTVSFEDAASLVFGGMTAQGFLAHAALRAGSRVLVNGAAGAVGTAVVQLAAIRGAHVTAVCSARNAELLRELGADRVVDYELVDFAGESARYDVVVDCVGNAGVERVAASIERGGLLLLVVAGLRQVVQAGRRRADGIRVETSVLSATSEQLRELMGLAEEGSLLPVIEKVFGFDAIDDAHRLVASGRKTGSAVLLVGRGGVADSRVDVPETRAAIALGAAHSGARGPVGGAQTMG